MKLTYRGVGYRLPKIEVKPQQSDRHTLDKHCLDSAKTNRRVILIRPIRYYTYRGVSYTKNLIFDTQSKLLLDIDRQ